MFVRSTCRTCGESLLLGCIVVERDAQRVLFDWHGTPMWHPCCDEAPSVMERLCAELLSSIEEGAGMEEQRLLDEIEKMQNRPPRLLDAALRYAGWGLPVFPLLEGSKKPATSHGFKDATTDVDRIAAWWGRHPTHNVGLPTGGRFDVIDVDTAKDGKPSGYPALFALLDKIDLRTGRGDLPDCHGIVSTPSSGLHLYVAPQGGGNMAGWVPGVDIRGAGGYVVAPPSRLGSGRGYVWAVPPSPALTSG